jgi:hypothetical protein
MVGWDATATALIKVLNHLTEIARCADSVTSPPGALITAGADPQARSSTGQFMHVITVAEGKPVATQALKPGS